MPIRVLIFDDDTDILEICSIVLEDKGFEIYTCINCHHVIEKIEAVHPDVILLDNRIPGKGGILTIQELKQSAKYKHIPVILFSANEDIAKIAHQAHADFFLEKPFNLDYLGTIVSTAAGIINK